MIWTLAIATAQQPAVCKTLIPLVVCVAAAAFCAAVMNPLRRR